MKKLSIILDKLLAIAQNAKIWLRVLVFVIVGTVCVVGGAVIFSRNKIQDCTFCEKQKGELIQALIEIKTMDGTTSIQPASYFQFASFIDTTPRQRILNRYIDSVLNKIKQDSIKKSKN